MKDNVYVLCFKGKLKNGKEEICPLYKGSLNFIDKFTTYGCDSYSCIDEEYLFKSLPKNVQAFINECFVIDEKNLKGCFFIRKSTKNIRMGKSDLPVLFYNDADVVYANESESLKSLLSLRIPLEEYDKKDDVTNLKKQFFKELFNLLSLDENNKLARYLDDVLEKKDYLFLSREKGLRVLPEVLEKLIEYVFKNYLLRRNTLALIKKYKIKINEITGCEIKFLKDKELKERISSKKYKYIFDELLHQNKTFFAEKYGFTFEQPKTEETKLETKVKTDDEVMKDLKEKLKSSTSEIYQKIITLLMEQMNLKKSIQEKSDDELYRYNKKNDYEIDYDRCKERILELNTLMLNFENLRNETPESKMHYEELIRLKVSKYDLEKSSEESLIRNDQELIDYFNKKIADLDELIESLENGDISYSDAGLLIEKDDDMKM